MFKYDLQTQCCCVLCISAKFDVIWLMLPFTDLLKSFLIVASAF